MWLSDNLTLIPVWFSFYTMVSCCFGWCGQAERKMLAIFLNRCRGELWCTGRFYNPASFFRTRGRCWLRYFQMVTNHMAAMKTKALLPFSPQYYYRKNGRRKSDRGIWELDFCEAHHFFKFMNFGYILPNRNTKLYHPSRTSEGVGILTLAEGYTIGN